MGTVTETSSLVEDDSERLKALTDPRRRGYEFQTFVGTLFRRAHFAVTPNPGTGGSRQVDLMAVMGNEAYLVETKWWSKRLNVAEIASLQDRLAKTTPSVVGVLVSYSDFTAEAVNRVESTPERPILLVTGTELERAVDWDGEFLRMVRQKRDAMQVHSKTVIVSTSSNRSRPVRKGTLPSAAQTFVLRDGTRSKCLPSGGDFGQFAFVRDLPDIDWVPESGYGVTLDIATSTRDEAGLITLLHALSDMGWLTGRSHWSIQQATANWHGAGGDKFADTLADWKVRYQHLRDIHHTEEFCYFDLCDDMGFYTLTGQVAAHSPRTVWRTLLSFQLCGIPIDPEPLRHLCDTFDARSSYFRPRGEKSVVRHHLGPDESVVLDVVGFVAEDNELESNPDDREWAVGLIAKNPFSSKLMPRTAVPQWWPYPVADSEFIVCSLRSWHPISNPKETYRLWSCEEAWTSDALVCCPVADWDDRQVEEAVPDALSRKDRPPRSRVTLVEL